MHREHLHEPQENQLEAIAGVTQSAENDRFRIKVVGCRDGNSLKMQFFRGMEEKGACRAESFIRN